MRAGRSLSSVPGRLLRQLGCRKRHQLGKQFGQVPLCEASVGAGVACGAVVLDRVLLDSRTSGAHTETIDPM